MEELWRAFFYGLVGDASLHRPVLLVRVSPPLERLSEGSYVHRSRGSGDGLSPPQCVARTWIPLRIDAHGHAVPVTSK